MKKKNNNKFHHGQVVYNLKKKKYCVIFLAFPAFCSGESPNIQTGYCYLLDRSTTRAYEKDLRALTLEEIKGDKTFSSVSVGVIK
jgi:hypothetical protein